MVIVAVKDDPGFMEMGLQYFDEEHWPREGYTLLKRVITDMSARELKRYRR